jgi:amino acid transporter
LAALAEQHQAPRIFGYIDRRGRPLVGIALASSIGFLAFLAGSGKQEDAFNWMLAISGLSSIFTWGSICLAHIRFRKGWFVQGHSLDELAFRSQPGIVGSWLGFSLNVLLLVAQFWTAFAPIGYKNMSTAKLVQNFFQAYLAAPLVIACYISYKIFYRTRIIQSHEMNLHSGLREPNLGELIADEKAEREQWPTWRKLYKVVC